MDREEIERLIGRVALKDRAAFEGLYDRVSAKLFGVCLRVLNNRAAAEDAMQDSFVKIWNNADRYSANGLSPMTWLITIARNTSIDRLRAQRSGHRDVNAPGFELPAPGPGPEESAIAASEAAKLAGCLDSLEADRGAAVRGAYLDGRSYADLAEQFGIPLNTMRTWLRRGLIALRECMSL
ncbi:MULTISPECIES: sigma-70 family RNA polymerase sigma factor [unclassified Sulfitobacter]|uniref:sigma-70 family RNA polymerase sigma factor n=1 Tax=unclassified Sulfitobacter TaxID=196795 RepID=UPI0007C276F1|nr:MULTISPECIES: sigma-70 family RNA polymerase sigma factor [unclassified Sulfitobacter]MAM25221.1 RNA polymerase subunit sigma [Paracoccaceae bacterium]KZY04460.1 RNA polymerase subunit sigma [Sulfitobacter sp. HI0023]KZY26103.1 RNA polymerase subunit sigma [Sulfitobacter sp. HI0040]KZZ69914.1 RNA polymerase subunit sigma [Sulfitobacter sp. HI0129]MBO28939.1 RNA polymerase subunit sigma [Paracoccaceae bacterium]